MNGMQTIIGSGMSGRNSAPSVVVVTQFLFIGRNLSVSECNFDISFWRAPPT
jgi:hypothetical protein